MHVHIGLHVGLHVHVHENLQKIIRKICDFEPAELTIKETKLGIQAHDKALHVLTKLHTEFQATYMYVQYEKQTCVTHINIQYRVDNSLSETYCSHAVHLKLRKVCMPTVLRTYRLLIYTLLVLMNKVLLINIQVYITKMEVTPESFDLYTCTVYSLYSAKNNFSSNRPVEYSFKDLNEKELLCL